MSAVTVAEQAGGASPAPTVAAEVVQGQDGPRVAAAVEWRDAPGFPDYEVSEYGCVRRSRPSIYGGVGYILVGAVDRKGYRNYNLRRGGSSHMIKAHRLVCEAFNGPCPPQKEMVCHRDDVKSNNHFTNLYWGTNQENMDDAKARLAHPRGTAHRLAKLDDDAVRAMRRMREEGYTNPEIGRAFGVCISTVSHVCTRFTWRHVDD